MSTPDIATPRVHRVPATGSYLPPIEMETQRTR
jgi:hypothetical protein